VKGNNYLVSKKTNNTLTNRLPVPSYYGCLWPAKVGRKVEIINTSSDVCRGNIIGCGENADLLAMTNH
jgi:hypothetical protein